MNNLNSVLLEGKVLVVSMVGRDVKEYSFALVSKSIVDKSECKLTINVTIDKRLNNLCSDFLEAGKVVRVVGRLTEDGLYAEHIEFKSN